MAEDKDDNFSILKIHGSVEQYKNFVTDKSDYDKFNQTQVYLVAKLITYLVDYPVIFIGYSANDPDIKKVLSSVKKIQYESSPETPVMRNMWFVDWKQKIDGQTPTADIKYLALDGTETIGVNYIQFSSFTPLFEALHQESIDVSALKTLQDTIYQIVKSASITKLNVDIANINYLKQPEDFLKLLSKKDVLLNLAKMADLDQVAAVFVLTPTDLAKKVLGPAATWYQIYQLIDKLSDQEGFNIRNSNNPYHMEITHVQRYSEKAVKLLSDFKDGQPVKIEIN
ncbi:hypothetical protein ATX61_09850 [Oenococcus oeni]|nr:hypothetical protein ATX61_09850 [Oenococcus oeni]